MQKQQHDPRNRGAGEVMRQEMRATRLLADGKHHADQDRRRECGAGEARAGPRQDEVKRHQCKSGGGMRAGITAPARQIVGSVAEKACVGPVTAIASEVARAVDIGDLLEAGDDGRAQQQGDRNECGAAMQVPQAQADDRHHQRDETDEAHQPGTAGVDHVYRPPAAGADPGLGRAIVEPGIGDAQVQQLRADCGSQQQPAPEPALPGDGHQGLCVGRWADDWTSDGR